MTPISGTGCNFDYPMLPRCHQSPPTVGGYPLLAKAVYKLRDKNNE